ncbi:MAG TPA: hypothetical protein VE007_12165, partial [Thermoanaerobaculia bacterium]|nr:hypothetical protein [Thermoanaerobaculia bacterium]
EGTALSLDEGTTKAPAVTERILRFAQDDKRALLSFEERSDEGTALSLDEGTTKAPQSQSGSFASLRMTNQRSGSERRGRQQKPRPKAG